MIVQVGPFGHAFEKSVEGQWIAANGLERLGRAKLAVLDLLLRAGMEGHRQHCEKYGNGERAHAHDLAPYSTASTLWICATTAAPSPTAAATRLVEPARTSPIANTPGRLVSSGSAGRPGLPPHFAPGQHESLVVEGNAAIEPIGIRLGADEQE